MPPIQQALHLLITLAFDLYTMVVAVRFLMQVTRANYYNPLAQAVVKLTNPVLVPLRRVIPGFKGQDIAALVLCLLLIVTKILVFKVLSLGQVDIAGYGLQSSALTLPLMAVLAPIDLLNLFINVFLFSMIILAVLSWVSPGGQNPAAEVLADISRPVTDPVRRWVKPIGGLDFSLLIAMVLLNLLKILLVGTLMGMVLGTS